MATEVKTQQKSNGIAWLVGMVVLVVIGAIAWGVQLSKGMSVLGINQIVVWGIYIAAFFALVGLASGLLILAVLSDLGVIQGLETVRRNLLIGSIASYIAGGFMILMDIGRPERVLNMVFSAQFSSPFVWDFFSLALGVIMAVILPAGFLDSKMGVCGRRYRGWSGRNLRRLDPEHECWFPTVVWWDHAGSLPC